MNLGEILDRTSQIYRKKFLVFAGIAALPALAMMGVHSIDSSWLHLSSLVHSSNRGGVIGWNIIVLLFFYHILSLLGLWILPASVKLASNVILGENGTILSSLRFAATRWRSYLWVAVLKVLATLVIPELLIAALLFAAALIEVFAGVVNGGKGFLTVFLLVLLVAGCVLFVWLGSCLSLAVPACAMEGIAGIRTIRRSWSLSKDSRFRVVFTWLMVVALSFSLMLTVRFFSWRIAIFFYQGHSFGIAAQHLYVETVYLLYAAVSAFVSPIYSIAITLIYYDQRIRQEGYDIERMMEAAGLIASGPQPSGDGRTTRDEVVEGQA
jgi:hypothetical protein